jgi:hypothetical protein
VPDFKLDELQHEREHQATASAAGRASQPEPGSGTRTFRSSARRAAAVAAPSALWRDHRLFTILAMVSLLPRILAALSYRPAMLTADSFLYMQEATKGTLGDLRPSGYSLFLSLLQYLPHALLAVTMTQHLMGIAIAALVYGLLRYWGLPAWGAVLAAVPALFDAREIALESYILPDTVYCLTIMVIVALLITKRTPRLWQCAVAGLLMAYVTVLRGNGLPLAVVVGAYLLIRRVGWRAVTAGVAAFALPVLGYVISFHNLYGQYNLTSSDGIFLWSRTTSFANCAIIKPPANLVPLCPNGSLKPPAKAPAWSMSALLDPTSPTDRLWASNVWWRHDAHPGINPYNNKLALQFSLDAIKAQPLGYLRVSAEDVMLTFLKNDRPQSLLTLAFTTTPHVPKLPSFYASDIQAYAGTTANTHVVYPYAYFLFLYQLPVYFPGFVFFAAVVAGLVGVIRKRRLWGGPAALPWALALLSLILPAMLTEALYRYALTAVPLACLAAGMAFIRQRPQPATVAAGPAWAPALPDPAPHATANQALATTTPDQAMPDVTAPQAPDVTAQQATAQPLAAPVWAPSTAATWPATAPGQAPPDTIATDQAAPEAGSAAKSSDSAG